MLAVFSPKGGSWSQAFHAWTAETRDEIAKFKACVIIRSPFVNIINDVLYEGCFAKTDALYDDLINRSTHSRPHYMTSSVFGMGRSTDSIA